MKVIKIIQTGLDILSPIQVYSDSTRNIFNILVQQCEGKCLRGCRIDKILQILHISECRIDSRGPDCSGSVFVRFEVEATVFSAGEVLNGCIVARKDSDIIIATHPKAAIMMKMHPALEGVRPGHIISVRVNTTTYDISADRISISAYPYLPSRKCVAYYAEGELSSDDKEYLESILEKIKQEEKTLSNEKNKKAISFFSDLLHPFEESESKKHGGDIINLLKLVKEGKFAPAFYCRNPRLPPIESNLVVYKDKIPEDLYIKENRKLDLRSIVTILLEDYYDALRIVREFVELYPTDVVAEHKHIWRIYMNTKKAPIETS